VVLLAPWGLHTDWWEYQMAFLAGKGLQCIGYDRRGHDRSVEPQSGYDFDTVADDLNTVIDRLDLRGVTLVGHAMGCGEVVRYLSRYSAHRVGRIVLVAPISPSPNAKLANLALLSAHGAAS
jgi:pimeloyl-ACP methyl ester carboxylesterase